MASTLLCISEFEILISILHKCCVCVSGWLFYVSVMMREFSYKTNTYNVFIFFQSYQSILISHYYCLES